MIGHECAFTTPRLDVREWHRAVSRMRRDPDLPSIVRTILTPAVTRSLPPDWQGPFTGDQAEDWVRQRDREGAALLVVDRSFGQAIGLLILHEDGVGPSTGVDLRLGYLLAETAWGQGLGSELVAGFVEWCSGQAGIRSITGGVAPDNIASIRILERNGFLPLDQQVPSAEAETIYRLWLEPHE